MASVFGICKVENSTKQNTGKFLNICKDGNREFKLTSNSQLPVGTQIYWEYWYRTGEWAFAVM